jgi:inosine-uridine nucleoside N-ribohydrolase
VEFVVTGALTNLAILLRGFPDIRTHIRGITLMGGAIGLGNWTPAAEFNMLVDPEAAAFVFSCGLPITMVPLEVTHTVAVNGEVFSELGKLSSSFGQKLVPLMRHFQVKYKQQEGFEFPVAHDPCTIHYLLHP